MPPNPIDEAANANQRPVLRSARSSERMVASGWAARPGIHRQSAANVTTPSTPTTTKATRQPTVCPMMVDSGTPTTFAIVSPAIIVATARPRRDDVSGALLDPGHGRLLESIRSDPNDVRRQFWDVPKV